MKKNLLLLTIALSLTNLSYGQNPYEDPYKSTYYQEYLRQQNQNASAQQDPYNNYLQYPQHGEVRPLTHDLEEWSNASEAYLAITTQDDARLQKALKKGLNPNLRFSSGLGFLHFALTSGNLQAVKTLLAHHANINFQDYSGYTPLYYTSYAGQEKETRFLLQAKADPNIPDINGTTPLAIAQQKGHTQIVTLLKKHHAKSSVSPSQLSTPSISLHEAISSRQSQLVTKLLKAGSNPNELDLQGRTPLYYAILQKDLATVQQLLQHRADPNQAQKNAPPLIQIAIYHSEAQANPDISYFMPPEASPGDPRILSLLLQHGANPNQSVGYKETPLHYVAKHGNAVQARLLIQHGANPQAKNHWGQTPLDIARDHYNQEVYFLLQGL